MTLLQAECVRLARNRTSVVVILAVLTLLLLSAIDAGSSASRYREHLQDRQQQWTERLDALLTDRRIVNPPVQDAAVASATFEFGRTDAPFAPRPALGGLALSVRQFTALPADVPVTLESRYVDSRRTEVIENPLLSAMGVPDFSVVVALLLPLLVIALTYGLVQEAREQGIWRLVRAQTPRPWQSFFWALGLRLIVVIAVVGAASTVAFGLDPGASMNAWLAWMLAASICALWWVALAGFFNLLRISSAATALGLLGAWLLTSFAAPAVLSSYAQLRLPGQSQLVTLREIREIQQGAESRQDELLEQWYRENPEHTPERIDSHTFPVTFVPRYLEQDRHIVPMMRAFEQLRSERVELIEPWMALAPGPALVLLSDWLAGSSAQQQNSYMNGIAQLERRWRAALVPGIMTYRGLNDRDVSVLGALRLELNLQSAFYRLLSCIALAAGGLMLLVVSLRRALVSPAQD